MREPETLRELKAEILRQLEKSETVTITLTDGDGIHELLESITDGIKGTEELNRQTRKYGDPILCANTKIINAPRAQKGKHHERKTEQCHNGRTSHR